MSLEDPVTKPVENKEEDHVSGLDEDDEIITLRSGKLLLSTLLSTKSYLIFRWTKWRII